MDDYSLKWVTSTVPPMSASLEEAEEQETFLDSLKSKPDVKITGNSGFVQLYRVLEKSNLMSYFQTFLDQGGDDISQFAQAPEDEFQDMMKIVKMHSKPLHVARFKKTLIEWRNCPENFMQPLSINQDLKAEDRRGASGICTGFAQNPTSGVTGRYRDSDNSMQDAITISDLSDDDSPSSSTDTCQDPPLNPLYTQSSQDPPVNPRYTQSCGDVPTSSDDSVWDTTKTDMPSDPTDDDSGIMQAEMPGDPTDDDSGTMQTEMPCNTGNDDSSTIQTEMPGDLGDDDSSTMQTGVPIDKHLSSSSDVMISQFSDMQENQVYVDTKQGKKSSAGEPSHWSKEGSGIAQLSPPITMNNHQSLSANPPCMQTFRDHNVVTMKPEMPLDLDDDLPSTSDYYLMFNSSLGGFDSATPAATSESLKQPSQHQMTPSGVFNGENISHDTTATTVTEFTGFNHNRALFSLLEQQSQKVQDNDGALADVGQTQRNPHSTRAHGVFALKPQSPAAGKNSSATSSCTQTSSPMCGQQKRKVQDNDGVLEDVDQTHRNPHSTRPHGVFALKPQSPAAGKITSSCSQTSSSMCGQQKRKHVSVQPAPPVASNIPSDAGASQQLVNISVLNSAKAIKEAVETMNVPDSYEIKKCKKHQIKIKELLSTPDLNTSDNVKKIRTYSAIYEIKETKRNGQRCTVYENNYKMYVNEAAAQLCMLRPALLTRRGDLYRLARQAVTQSGYTYSKGKSRSKMNEIPPDVCEDVVITAVVKGEPLEQPATRRRVSPESSKDHLSETGDEL